MQEEAGHNIRMRALKLFVPVLLFVKFLNSSSFTDVYTRNLEVKLMENEKECYNFKQRRLS